MNIIAKQQTRFGLLIAVLLLGGAAMLIWHWSSSNRHADNNPVGPMGVPMEGTQGRRSQTPRPLQPAYVLPPEVAAQVSRWSPQATEYGTARRNRASNSGNGNPKKSNQTQPPSPFPEPKKVLAPEEIQSGKW